MKRPSFIIKKHLVKAWCLLGLMASLASCSSQPRYAAPPVEGGNIVIQIAPLSPEVPQFYSYRTQGKDVNFFVIRLQDRVISFLDACLSCYPHKLGYKCTDGFVVCRACNTTYSIYKLEKGIGGCYPIKLEGRTENSRYLIPVAELERMARKF